MKQKLNSIFQSEGLRQSALMASGNVAATGFSAISLIILSRFLGPENFGGFSVAFSLTQIIGSVFDFGLNLSLQRIVASNVNQDQAKTISAIQLVGKLKIASMALTIIAGLTLGPILADTLFHVNDPSLVVLGVALSSIVLMYGYVVTIIQAIAKYSLAVGLNAIQAILKCGLAIVSYFYLPPNPTLAYLWYGLAPLVATLFGLKSITKYFRHQLVNVAVWKEIVHVARYGAIAVLAIAIGDNIDVLMVNASLTEYETGLYSAASRVALMLAVFGGSFGIVFNTRVAKYKNKSDLDKFLYKALLFAAVSIALIPIGVLLAKPLLLLTAGTGYLGGLTAMRYLIISAFIVMAAVPFIAVFYAVDYPVYFAIAGVIQSVLLIAGNAILIPLYGIEGAGVAKLITRLVVTIFTIVIAFYQAKKQFGIAVPKFNKRDHE